MSFTTNFLFLLSFVGIAVLNLRFDKLLCKHAAFLFISVWELQRNHSFACISFLLWKGLGEIDLRKRCRCMCKHVVGIWRGG